ncbi:hypothetical protein [Haloarcula onubensis]|uniref:SHOCT domain-containing protein n=1 Tax=Haloarcula onubensis TaxID=2950539 RepID=A0ABU2FKH1_9EURY|nr:hypothetical protein [Halomicroarcula sp. S3CR25-11]MDS0281208.1 hypothetical protein [Halomicroarcula sp. S3CR25-11]
MSFLADNRHWLLFAATVLSGLGTVGVAVTGVLATVSVLVTGGSLVLTVGGFLLATLVLGGLTLVFAAALLSTLASRASLPSVPRSQRAANVLHGLEAAVPPLRRLGLADRLEPTVEDRRAALKARYVEGDLSEHQFEAALHDLLDEEERRVPEVESLDADETTPTDRERELERE